MITHNEEISQTATAKTDAKKEAVQNLKMWSFAWELGYIIAIPIIVLALLGRFLDKKLLTSPLFLIAGIFLSLIITGVLIWKKVRNTIE